VDDIYGQGYWQRQVTNLL